MQVRANQLPVLCLCRDADATVAAAAAGEARPARLTLAALSRDRLGNDPSVSPSLDEGSVASILSVALPPTLLLMVLPPSVVGRTNSVGRLLL